MTPALQSITNAMNMTISHFEQMQRVSGNSIDTSAFQAARNEIRNAEATFAEMQEALTGVARNSADVTRGFDDIGLAANRAGQPVSQIFRIVQQQQGIIVGIANTFEAAIQQMTRTIQQQTNEIIKMSEAIHQATNRTTEHSRRQTEESRRQTEESRRQTEEFRRQTEESRRRTEESRRQTEEFRRRTEESRRQTEEFRRQMEDFRRQTENSRRGFHRLTDSIKSTNNSANTLSGTLKRLAGVYLSLQGFNLVGKLSDDVTSVLSRLNLMNDGLQTTKELSDKIMHSSFEAGADYLTTASSIAKMGLNAGSAFTSNDELIAFMDQINKTFAIGGATAEEQNNAMIQLTQAMAAGALRGEELNSILDSGPGIARNIEKYMGWAEGSIKSYAEEGKVTAQIVKNAMLSMAQETNEKFNSMPATIGQTFSRIKTLALKAFTPVLQGINGLFNNQNAQKIAYYWGAAFQYIADRVTVTIEKLKNIMNSEAFQVFSRDITAAFSAAGAVATWVFDTIVNAFDYVVGHWEAVKPVLMGISVVLGAVTAAQWALNLAMYANPVGLIIIGIGVLIGLFYKLVDWINKTKNTNISATGIIAGCFAGMYATIKNVMIAVWNGVANVVNFVYNFSKDPIAAIKVLFLDTFDTILAGVQAVIQTIKSMSDRLPHIPIVTDFINNADDSLEKARAKIEGISQNIKDKTGYKEIMKQMEYSNPLEAAENVHNKVADFTNGIKTALEGFDPFKGTNSTNDILDDILKNLQKTSNNTKDISDTLKMDKEDLEFMKTLANIKYGDKYVMPQVKVEMTNHNTIQKEMDLDGFFDRKVEEIGHLISMSAEGVHI